ncbi:MAG TPA: efflux RND transporter periplasmic adaptor subunit, partial [Candidatus Saccharimonadales bacterium]|nr:efflux RND transporter periplasmic adaptor subunit [Candidatus Saccharimonadales bacterium]
GVVVRAAAAAIILTRRSHIISVHTAMAREVANPSVERTVLNASGYVTARRQATISSKVTGKVTEVLVEEGMKIVEGQVLARLDKTNIEAGLQLSQAQAELARSALAETEIRIKESNKDLQRQTFLLSKDTISRAEFDHTEASALAYEARLVQQRADITVDERAVDVWQRQLDDTVIRAPFSGIVTSKNAQPGEMISPISAGGGFTRTGICTIVDMTSLEIEIDVNETYINRVISGQRVEATLDAYPEWKILCRVIAIIPTANRDTSTVKVRVGFEQMDPRILPEMSAKVAFREKDDKGRGEVGTVSVPKSAVRQVAGQNFVMVVHENRTDRRQVAVNGISGADIVLSAGVAAGERVIVDGPADLDDRATVKEIDP